MISLERDELHIRVPEVHEAAHMALTFKRTLRLPDDGQTYPLPPGLDNFPVRHAEDFPKLDKSIRSRGGVIIPMHPSEAMWMNFSAYTTPATLDDHGPEAPALVSLVHTFPTGPDTGGAAYPFALKIGAGKINALTGEAWSEALSPDDQDYLVVPTQPWLDGFAVAKGIIRQFVAERLGSGFSAEEQITGRADWGGIQILAYPMKAKIYDERVANQFVALEDECRFAFSVQCCSEMGLGAGGRMSQSIYEDPFGIEAWDQSVKSRVFITMLDAQTWLEVTGEPSPLKPLQMQAYVDAGLPWFAHYAPNQIPLEGSKVLAGLKTWSNSTRTKGGVSDGNW